MIIDDLFEKAQQDVSMAQEARNLTSKIGQAIYGGKRADYFVELEGYGEFLVYDGTSMGLPRPIAILFGLKNPDAIGLSGGVYRFEPNLVVGRHSYLQGVVIYGLSKVTEDAVKVLVNSTSFYAIMRHEMIHVLDTHRTDGKITTKGGVDSKNSKKYYNDPNEFNAYYHDIVSNLTSLINDVRECKPEDRTSLAELYGFTGDFKTDLERLLKPIDAGSYRFLKWLKNGRRKALIRRIYKLYQEFLSAMDTQPVTEAIQTKDLYQASYSAVLAAFNEGVKNVRKYKEGEYWAGDIITLVQNALEPIIKSHIDGKIKDIFFIVKLIDESRVSGKVHDPKNGNLIVTLGMPKDWFSESPNMFFYIIRENGKRMANEIAACFVHEIVHLEQKHRRGFYGGGTANADPTLYLSHADEIEPKAISTALELIHWAGDAASALSFLRKATTDDIENAGLGIAPHLGEAFYNLRKQNPAAWHKYLKAVVRCLEEHLD